MYVVDAPFVSYSLETYDPATKKVGTLSSGGRKGKWTILFFYPADFTFVCPTELADLNARYADFKELKTEVISVSTDTVYTHKAWLDAEALLKGVVFPMAADHNGKLSRELGIYDDANGMAQRAAFIIDPDNILRAAIVVSDPIGRSAQELLRMIKALQFVRAHPGKVCPLTWEQTGTITPSIKNAGNVNNIHGNRKNS
ncbi:MAG TPA: peroxiredoxin [Candidatus Paceibacterota bacterium]|nr:peroxiredoxin [Candidatus Paceibacterota bacterium]